MYWIMFVNKETITVMRYFRLIMDRRICSLIFLLFESRGYHLNLLSGIWGLL